MLSLPQMPAVQYDVVALAGGFDQVTSAYQLAPGALRDCINFACRTNGGYYRIPGYERFDGRPSPSAAEFIPIDVTIGVGETLAVGDTGMFGNIAGTVSYVDPFGKYVTLTKTVSAFDTPLIPGPIMIGGDDKGVANAYYSGLDIKDIATNKAAAANIYRADIGVVPGSGPIRGVAYYKDHSYAWRDNVGATACAIYKSSDTGWQPVPLGSTLPFTAMSAAPILGGTLTQGGVTATMDSWVIASGDITGGTAAGYFVISDIAGGTFAAGAATFAGGTVTLSAAATAITLLPGGRYDFSVGSFVGGANSAKLYGADGVNDGFEFDGETYTPIVLEYAEKPKFVQIHAQHLFFAIGSSLVHSAIGNPYNYEIINGAGEIAVTANVSGMIVLPGTQGSAALAAFTRNSTWILYGTSSADWNFVNFNLGVGAWEHTSQNLFDAFALDDRGVTMMKQSLNYGNFDAGTLTYNIRPFIHQNRGLATCSGLNRENGQYRVFFSNGYGLYCTTKPDGFVGHGVVLYPDPVVCSFDADVSDGTNISIFGTASGYVMQNDVGTSFDGASIPATITTNINCTKSPRVRKRYRRAALEIQATAYVEMQIGYSFEWASANILPHLFVQGEGFFSGLSFWDKMIWDAFFWDGKSDDSISIELNGTGENVQMMIVTDSDYVAEYTLASVIFHYTPRRGNR